MIVLGLKVSTYLKMNILTASQLLIHILKHKHIQYLDLSQKSVIILKKKKKS